MNMVFASDLRDAEPGEVASFFDRVRPGISEQEVQDMISTLRDKNSPASRSARLQLQPEKIDDLEGILGEAVHKNVEDLF